MIILQFGFSQFISFREEDLWNFSQSQHIIGPGSHVKYPTGTKNSNFVEDHPGNIPAKFGSNRPSGFGEEAWNVKSFQTTDDGRQVMAIVHMDLWFRWTKNQQNRQTGSRNLMGPKTPPTIWGTHMKLVTKYQISAINSYWEKCDEKYLGRTEGRTDGGKTEYPPPPSRSGGIKIECKIK